MGDKSGIEWTDATWNPLAGCTAVSPGCTHCYAATMAKRLEAMGVAKYEGTAERRGSVDVFTGRINTDEVSLSIPLKWQRPRKIFVNSMSDLFHEAVEESFIARVFAVMWDSPRHTYQVLTKRPERMSDHLNDPQFWRTVRGWLKGNHKQCAPENCSDKVMSLPNVWLGTSCEDQVRADQRIPYLLTCPAVVRFLSCEPLLGPIVLKKTRVDGMPLGVRFGNDSALGMLIGWVIVGGESGHGARPMHPQWVRSLRDECQEATVPFFFKQWGESAPDGDRTARASLSRAFWMLPDGATGDSQPEPHGYTWMSRVGSKLAGCTLDGREWSEFPKAMETA